MARVHATGAEASREALEDTDDASGGTLSAADIHSLKALRRNLNELRRQARELEDPALEQCLTLAISLTSTRTKTD